jgi:hypothetical protein
MRYRSTDKPLRTLSDWPSVLLTLAVCLVCWFLYYVYPTGFPPERNDIATPLWTFAGRLFENRLVACLAGLSVVLVAAFVVQRISDVERLVREHTRLPFMLLMLLMSTNAGLLPVKVFAVVLLCLLFVVSGLIRSYQSPALTGRFFNTGVLMAFAGLFFPQTVWFIPLLWIGMYRLRSLSLKNFLALFTGVLVVCWMVAGWCVWTHDFFMITSFFRELTDFQFFSIEIRADSVVVVLILVMAFFHIRTGAFSNSVRVRRIFSFLISMSVWSLVLILFYGKDADLFLAVAYLPSSVLMAYFLENINRKIRFVLYYCMLLTWFASFILRVWTF